MTQYSFGMVVLATLFLDGRADAYCTYTAYSSITETYLLTTEPTTDTCIPTANIRADGPAPRSGPLSDFCDGATATRPCKSFHRTPRR